MKRRWIAIMLVLASLCAVMFAAQASAATSAEETRYDLSKDLDKIKMVGRTAVDEKGIQVSWTNSGIAFEGEFSGEVKLEASASAAYMNIAVVVDGEYDLPARFAIYSGTREYVIADVEPGHHLVEIFKLNEAAWGYFTFRSLTVNGELTSRPADKPLQMEIIGDSLSCCLGIYPSGGKNDYPVVGGKSMEEEDSYFGYVGLLSRALNADASVVSLSGWGIMQGHDNPELRVPRIYDQICGVVNGPSVEAWDFANHQVDLIICNQCTNDWLFWSQGNEEALKAGIVDFCHTLRAKYPNAEIVWCYGMMHTLMEDTIRSAVESVGDAKLHYTTLPTNTAGGAQHSDYWGHDATTQHLLSYLKELGIQ